MDIINITTPINNLSYGYVGQNLVKALIKAGISVHLRYIGNMEPDEEAGYGDYVRQCGNTFVNGAPHLIVWHHFQLKQLAIPDCPNIGFPIFETNEFNVDEIDNFNSMDKIIVAAAWYKNILEKNGTIKKPVHVVNLGYDPDIFKATPNKFDGDKVHFLHIGKWEIRKNQLGLLKAFSEEFGFAKDVDLTLACENPFIGPDNKKWVTIAKHYVPAVNILPCRFSSCKEIASLIQSSNVGCYASLSEGFNLPLLETMASNRESIATMYSAHTQFCNEWKNLLINIDGEAPMYDGQFFHGSGQWAAWNESQHLQLRKQLREAYNTIKMDEVSDIDVNEFTWDNSIKQLLEIL